MTRFRRHDAGISMVLVVVLIMISLIFSVAAAALWADYKAKERQKLALEAEILVVQAESAAIRAQFKGMNEPTGLDMGEGESPSREKGTEYMRTKRAEYVSKGAFDRYPTLVDTPKPMTDNDASALEAALKNSTLYDRLQDLVPVAAQRTWHFKNRAEQLELELAIAVEQKNNRESVKSEIPKRKIEEAARLQARIAEVNKYIGEENETYNARKAKHTEDKSKAETETAAEVEKWAQEEIMHGNQTRELRRQLEDLKVKEVIKHEISFIHGKVLLPDIPNKTAFIDIGSRERAVPGLKFLVGKRGVHNKFEYKGKIEVKKAWMDRCEVAIIELYDPKNRPIVEGDYIVNPLFSKERAVVVAFVGEDRPLRLRYTVDEATRRIREIGSEVRKDVALDIDYVIFTEVGSQRQRDSYEPFKKAIFLEIPIAEAGRTKEEPDLPGLFEFLGD